MSVLPIEKYDPIKLPEDFVADYSERTPPWGFGPLSWVTYKRTYSRTKTPSWLRSDAEADGEPEDWWETCRRVIEGMLNVQMIHCKERSLPWNDGKAIRHGKRAYDRLFNFKWTPPGRGLWMMGTDFMFTRTGAALNNCGFTSTKNISEEGKFAEPFGWMFENSMLGVGVGFDTKGIGARTIVRPALEPTEVHVVEDSREGWRSALERVLNAFVGEDTMPNGWDFSEVRPKGAPIKSFGGVASGPGPLKKAIETLEGLYESYVGKSVDAQLIVDTMNIAGRCVVAGGVRRTAQIAFGDEHDEQFLDLKQDFEKLGEYRWASNNSINAEVGMDYSGPGRRTSINGEPGYLWLKNAQAFGRMKDAPNWDDEQAEGSNPCVEQTLWDKELCCLVETFPAHHDSINDYKETLKCAYQYAKTVTLVKTHDEKTNAVMLKNRRIGCSMTGIVQAINKHGYREFFEMCDQGYDRVQELDKQYSDWLCIPRSIKTTSVKPSGTVSLLAGATPGVHWDHAPYYIRRIRVRDTHELVDLCRDAGYPVEPCQSTPNTTVIEFPVQVPHLERTKFDVSVREKVDLAAQMQHYWSDNQVSCTAEFDPETEGDEIPRLLEAYETRLKGISFLPSVDSGYAQMPYEAISQEEYERRARSVKPLEGMVNHDQEDKFCSGVACKVEFE